ncbi:HlyD family efflux transporter periplasmic adaptor subunit, partial [Desulfobacterales bacterium HSG17]|nr:HlyD family efflux transporter periplasmic adaptor subunit [Desulfobacterales bacterium HSG17]
LLKKWLIVIPVILGVLLVMLMLKSKREPVRVEAKERVRTVRVITAEKIDIVPRVMGYGYVTPTQTWEAIPEVSGNVIQIHDELKVGSFIPEGDLLFKIDSSQYGMAESRGQSDVMSIDAQMRELEQNKKNTERLLAVEKKSLELAGKELKRKREIFTKGFVSRSVLEKEEQSYLAQQSSVNRLQNTLDLIPAQRKSLSAQKKTGTTKVSERQLDIAKTEIRAPFDCRIAEVKIELDQFAAMGTPLLKIVNISSVEIPVQVSPGTFMNLLPRIEQKISVSDISMEQMRRAIGISARVRIPLFKNDYAVWEGRFSRTSESINLSTGAITIYVTVDSPYADIGPGKRPPLGFQYVL